MVPTGSPVLKLHHIWSPCAGNFCWGMHFKLRRSTACLPNTYLTNALQRWAEFAWHISWLMRASSGPRAPSQTLLATRPDLLLEITAQHGSTLGVAAERRICFLEFVLWYCKVRVPKSLAPPDTTQTKGLFGKQQLGINWQELAFFGALHGPPTSFFRSISSTLSLYRPTNWWCSL
jgi:hypothetical protein